MLFIFRSLYLCAIGLWPIFSFRWNLPPILSCIPKQLDSSKELYTSESTQSHTGFSPSMTSCSKELRPELHPKHLLQITTRTLKEPDFKFELLPLHSPLLRQSLLVSFPPLIDMLKFSGYSYLIRGQHLEIYQWTDNIPPTRQRLCACGWISPSLILRHAFRALPNTKELTLRGVMTLEQVCPSEYQRAQYAFKDSMIHWILQFTLLIAFRCVLHRCQNQEIRCWKF